MVFLDWKGRSILLYFINWRFLLVDLLTESFLDADLEEFLPYEVVDCLFDENLDAVFFSDLVCDLNLESLCNFDSDFFFKIEGTLPLLEAVWLLFRFFAVLDWFDRTLDDLLDLLLLFWV
jgi:hypothetical protein